jgi:DNA-binding GntR family transcriptional regulator
MVLTEEPLSRHFNTSRTTIRKALSVLNDTQMITRFAGRGFLVGFDSTCEPKRASIETLLLETTTSADAPRAISNPERILPALRDQLIRALPFGPLQISEAVLMEQFSVSRTVIRETLAQLKSSGIVEKNERSKWVLPVLTAADVRNHYQLRILLEPAALREVAATLPKAQTTSELGRINHLIALGSEPTSELLSELEQVLHVDVLSGCHNDHLLKTLQRSRLVLAINEMFRLLLGRTTGGAQLLQEHREIFAALAEDRVDDAAERLAHHLTQARERTCMRLKTLSVLRPPELPSYLSQATVTIR